MAIYSILPTLQVRAATWGHFHHNTVSWKCSGYDIDTSSNIIFEDNTVVSTEAGVIPHGNSISFCKDLDTPLIRHPHH